MTTATAKSTTPTATPPVPARPVLLTTASMMSLAWARQKAIDEGDVQVLACVDAVLKGSFAGDRD